MVGLDLPFAVPASPHLTIDNTLDRMELGHFARKICTLGCHRMTNSPSPNPTQKAFTFGTKAQTLDRLPDGLV